MLVELKNDLLRVQINPLGAELWQVQGQDGTQYLWQGKAEYWQGRATNLFPYVGRLTEGEYTVGGRLYHMGIHGFLRHAQTTPRDVTPTHALFECGDTPETLAQYPFPFRLGVEYTLEGSTLRIAYHVHNPGSQTMFFGLGGHPGFNVPLQEGLAFEDYTLQMDGECERALLSPQYFITGEFVPCPVQDGALPLRHDLFDDDAIVLRRTGHTVKLSSPRGQRAVILRHPQMKYLGIWHRPHSDAPFVCLEPWVSLPSRQDAVEALETQPDLVRLPAGQDYVNRWEIEFI